HGKAISLGDFNEILTRSEKEGGVTKSERQINEFKHTLNDCMLRDLRYRGCPFTWCNGRTGVERILCQLDRCTGTTEWLSLFPHAIVRHEISGVSDNCPMRPSLLGRPDQEHKRRKVKKLEAMWVKDAKCE
ncbi:hypothetical protein CFOL_v3_22068, partial [Cephalotus follicularis]